MLILPFRLSDCLDQVQRVFLTWETISGRRADSRVQFPQRHNFSSFYYNCGHRYCLCLSYVGKHSDVATSHIHESTYATMDAQTHKCPKCKFEVPLSECRRRSVSQGRAPSWCRSCRNAQDRKRRKKKRIKAINEPLRRIRWTSPAEAVIANFAASAKAAGGLAQLGSHLHRKLKSENPDEQLRAVRIHLKLAIAVAEVRAD